MRVLVPVLFVRIFEFPLWSHEIQFLIRIMLSANQPRSLTWGRLFYFFHVDEGVLRPGSLVVAYLGLESAGLEVSSLRNWFSLNELIHIGLILFMQIFKVCRGSLGPYSQTLSSGRVLTLRLRRFGHGRVLPMVNLGFKRLRLMLQILGVSLIVRSSWAIIQLSYRKNLHVKHLDYGGASSGSAEERRGHWQRGGY